MVHSITLCPLQDNTKRESYTVDNLKSYETGNEFKSVDPLEHRTLRKKSLNHPIEPKPFTIPNVGRRQR